MLHLIASFLERALPAPVHRAVLPIAHRVRHRWRRLRKTPIAGVSAILTNRAGDVLLLRHSYGPEVWGLPGGGLKPGEDPIECTRREVHEELGLSLDTIEPVGTLEEELSGSPHTAHLFAAVVATDPVPDGREVLEARFFPADNLPGPLGPVTERRIAAWKAT
ncbi:NUDIX domain-containing protein [Erythrobacter sp. Alg231-14]|uniref:NUDIX domain-containing protein n=1 Tax=Erythrobacter sp. Alg231-14 TaxID=1922225 RepID=UPI000D554936